MRNILFVVAMFVTSCAVAQFIDPSGAVKLNLPKSIPNGDGVTLDPPWWLLRQKGWSEYVPCPELSGSNIATRVTNVINGVYVEQCGYTAAQPMEYSAYPEPSTTIPVLDTNGVVVGSARLLAMQGSLQLVLVTNEASPMKPWPVQRASFLEKSRATTEAQKKAQIRRTSPTVEQTKTNLLGVIAKSSGNAQRDAIISYLEWLTLELQAMQEQ